MKNSILMSLNNIEKKLDELIKLNEAALLLITQDSSEIKKIFEKN